LSWGFRGLPYVNPHLTGDEMKKDIKDVKMGKVKPKDNTDTKKLKNKKPQKVATKM
jgi:hypothetical protein